MLSNLFVHITAAAQKMLMLHLLLVPRTYLDHLTNYLDYFPSLSCNDSSLLLYYFTWTQQFYLNFTFMTLLVVLLLAKLQLTDFFKKVSLSLLLVMLAYSKYNYFTLNTNALSACEAAVDTNELLTNNLNKMHPALLYVTITSLLVNVTSRCQFFNENKMRLQLALATLTLGAWWAFQEGSWGGWWNWDPSETLGLLLMLTFLWVQHRVPSMQNHWDLDKITKEFMLALFICYLTTQLGFALISHNFSELIVRFSNPDFLSVVLVMLSLGCLLTFQCSRLDTNRRSLNNSKSEAVMYQNSIIYLLSYLLTTMMLLISFKLLLNDFVWRLLKLNFFNYAVPLQKTITMLMTFLMLWIWSPFKLALPLGCSTLWVSHLTSILFNLFSGSMVITNLIHFAVTLGVFVNLENATKTTLKWSTSSDCWIQNMNPSIEESTYVFVFNPGPTQVAQNGLIFNNTSASNFNLLPDTLNNQLHMFSCSATSDSIIQTLSVGSYLYKHSVCVYEENLLPMYSLVMLTSTFLFALAGQHKVILF